MKTLAFICGLILGFGLLLSGMTDPAKVLAFLDIAGPWDPSLILVMASAVLVAFPLIQLASRRRTALLGDAIAFPPRFGIDARLLLGSAIFGVGWGLDGLCPGPSLASLGGMRGAEGLFFIAMLAGMLGFEVWQRNVKASRMARPTAEVS
ncbi:MAG: hypothetical protein B7X31_03305 [Thiomonas sp. 13-66-29]|nr:MAG: hypothetical protein B7X31_03305 [Thiomonas sp. 13-66-29]